MRGISKKQIRTVLNYSNRRVFIEHLEKSGLKEKLPPYFLARNTYYGDEIRQLEEVFEVRLEPR